MIRICVERWDDGMEISAVGHAGYDRAGRDIVCAGVSALLFGFLTYLRSSLPVATAKNGAMCPFRMSGGSGDCGERETENTSASVEHRVGEGSLWIRTHGMKETDTAAWAVTAAGLFLLAEHYPGHVRLDI